MVHMDIFLQIWGGGCYLINKICFSLGEGRQGKDSSRLQTAGWLFYLSGVPAWVIILMEKHDWIAASIEAGGIPSMIFGLANTLRAGKEENRRFRRATTLITYVFIIIGLGSSFADYGGLVSFHQLLEVFVTIGFLMGSLLMAAQKKSGWLFFLIMNISMGILMLQQGKPFLAVQQLISLGFVLYGFLQSVGGLTPLHQGQSEKSGYGQTDQGA